MARPTKEKTENLTTGFLFRMHPNDKARYKKQASSRGMSLSEYIRHLIEQDGRAQPLVIQSDNDNKPSVLNLDDKVLHELHRIGNNLNQLTKKYHSKNIEPKGLRSLYPVLERLLTHIFKRINVE